MSDAHGALRLELSRSKALHEALLKEAHTCCQHILGHTRKGGRSVDSLLGNTYMYVQSVCLHAYVYVHTYCAYVRMYVRMYTEP